MSFDRVIAEVAGEYKNFRLEDAQDEPVDARTNHCKYAQVFEQWAVDLLREYVRREPNMVSFAQAKVHLIDRYFEWRVAVPKSHRNRIGEGGHTCIFHVFEQAYHQIKMAELILAPSVVVVSPPPAPPALPQVAGIYLGEVIGDED